MLFQIYLSVQSYFQSNMEFTLWKINKMTKLKTF